MGEEHAEGVGQVPYPKVYYKIAAAGCLMLGVLAGGYSVYLYPLNGQYTEGVAAVLVGILWMVIGLITVKLQQVHHA